VSLRQYSGQLRSTKFQHDFHPVGKAKPTDNALVESFNGRLRQECLNERWFMSLAAAKAKIEAWRLHYNEGRPHSALNGLSPKRVRSKLLG
jgi:putative transposase